MAKINLQKCTVLTVNLKYLYEYNSQKYQMLLANNNNSFLLQIIWFVLKNAIYLYHNQID